MGPLIELPEEDLAFQLDVNLFGPYRVVTVPFEAIKGIYDYLATVLGPYGLELDYERIKATRPTIAAMLR